MKNQSDCARFGLHDGQFFGYYRYKNLWWWLNGKEIGYGDLREEDIQRISQRLSDGEEFVGWNEHHQTRFQQTRFPMIRILPGEVYHRPKTVA